MKTFPPPLAVRSKQALQPCVKEPLNLTLAAVFTYARDNSSMLAQYEIYNSRGRNFCAHCCGEPEVTEFELPRMVCVSSGEIRSRCTGELEQTYVSAAVCEFARLFLQQPNAISRSAHVRLVWRVAKALFATPIGDFLV